MVWCELSPNGLFGPYFFDEIVTGSTYRQMLVDYAWSQLQRKRLLSTLWNGTSLCCYSTEIA